MSLTKFQHQVLKHALDKLFYKDTFFSICTVRELADMLGIHVVGGKDFKALQAIHCVYWAEMTPAFRQEVKNTVERLLEVTSEVVEEKVIQGSRVFENEAVQPSDITSYNIKPKIRLAFWRK